MITTPLPNGHVFLGSTRDFDDAASAWCCRCGALVKSRYSAITSNACPGRIAAEAKEERPAAAPQILAASGRFDVSADDMASMLTDARVQARAEGIADERARVMRIRNKAFTGKAVDDDMRKLLADFDGMFLRGEDDAT